VPPLDVVDPGAIGEAVGLGEGHHGGQVAIIGGRAEIDGVVAALAPLAVVLAHGSALGVVCVVTGIGATPTVSNMFMEGPEGPSV
jgi:hypothetical protein